MVKYKGQLNYYGLEDWWLTSFTSVERVHIESITSLGKDGSFLTKGNSFMGGISKLTVISDLSTWLSNEDEPDLYLKIHNEGKKFIHEATLEDQHSFHGDRIAILQRNLRKWDNTYELLKEACYKQIEISEDVAKYFKKNGSSLPYHQGFHRLAIMLQKEKIHSEVVIICKKALKETWTGDWEKRINTNEHKIDTPTKVVNKRKKIKPKLIYNGTVPLLEGYFPSYEGMNNEQKKYYNKIIPLLKDEQYVDVECNIGYIYVYLYELIKNRKKHGFDGLYELLTKFFELYNKEEKLKNSCLFWAYDCLIGSKKYKEYLDKTTPTEFKGIKSHFSNLRLNLQEHIGEKPNLLDIMALFEIRKSKFISNNKNLYTEKVIGVLSEYGLEHGGWFKILQRWTAPQNLHDYYLFSGTHDLQVAEFKTKSYYSIGDNISSYKNLLEKAENLARKEIGVPLVGEGWVSESELYRNLAKTFSTTKVLQHGTPSWLGRQHYDIWFPDWNIAVEYHGKQHFEPVGFFGGEEAYKKTVERDLRKIKISVENNVKLLVVKEGYNLDKLIKDINENRAG